jgi:hypothetical protein
MSDRAGPGLELLNDRAVIAAVVQRAVREAVLAHARAGNPVATWKDGGWSGCSPK